MAEVRISPAETLDAFRTVDRMGMEDRQQLKESLALVLPKTAEERPDSATAKGAAGKKGKAAPKKGKGDPTEAELEAMKQTKSLCAAFRKDVLEGKGGAK